MNPEKYARELKAVFTGLITYFTTVLLISFYKNNFQLFPFCGSYRDFTSQEPVPTVCLSLPEYLSKAVFHPGFLIPASVTGIIIGLVYYGEAWKYFEEWRS